MLEHAQFNPKEPDRETYIKIKEMDLESGFLGKFFGSSKNAAINIAGLVVLVVVLSGAIITLVAGGNPAVEYWKIITPIITMVLGFLFGRRT